MHAFFFFEFKIFKSKDFDEHGIAPKSLQIKSDYKDKIENQPKASKLKPSAENFLNDLIQPARGTIGVRMLRF